MKKLALLLLMISTISRAQETAFILSHGGGFNEEYYVLAGDKKIKHGPYVKYISGFTGFALIETGNYKNGEKDGVWQTLL
jgi:hypothetical protein